MTTKQWTMVSLFVVLGAGVGGCAEEADPGVDPGVEDGSQQQEQPDGAVSFSCDLSIGGVRTCSDYVFPAAVAPAAVDSAKAACSQSGAVVGVSCDKVGAVGGCRMIAGPGGQGSGATVWYYDAALAAGLESGCQQAGGTWVTP